MAGADGGGGVEGVSSPRLTYVRLRRTSTLTVLPRAGGAGLTPAVLRGVAVTWRNSLTDFRLRVT